METEVGSSRRWDCFRLRFLILNESLKSLNIQVVDGLNKHRCNIQDRIFLKLKVILCCQECLNVLEAVLNVGQTELVIQVKL